jgi:hypothetical protein
MKKASKAVRAVLESTPRASCLPKICVAACKTAKVGRECGPARSVRRAAGIIPSPTEGARAARSWAYKVEDSFESCPSCVGIDPESGLLLDNLRCSVRATKVDQGRRCGARRGEHHAIEAGGE